MWIHFSSYFCFTKQTWFKHQRSKYIGVERMEPKAATPQTLSPNTSPSLFYEESESIKWRDLQPEEQTCKLNKNQEHVQR